MFGGSDGKGVVYFVPLVSLMNLDNCVPGRIGTVFTPIGKWAAFVYGAWLVGVKASYCRERV